LSLMFKNAAFRPQTLFVSFLGFTIRRTVISLNKSIKLIFVRKIHFLPCEVEYEYINVIYINYGLQRVKAAPET